jgi:putative endonuclease
MARHNELGKKGEEKAIAFLTSLGHVLIATNYRAGRDEVDIITRHHNTIVFTEVKTRSTDYYGKPEEFVDKKKRKAMKKVADAFMAEHKLDTDIRFDIVSIIDSHGDLNIYHIPDAFFDEENDRYN